MSLHDKLALHTLYIDCPFSLKGRKENIWLPSLLRQLTAHHLPKAYDKPGLRTMNLVNRRDEELDLWQKKKSSL